MIAEEVIPSFSIPNLPGYKLNNSKSWIYVSRLCFFLIEIFADEY